MNTKKQKTGKFILYLLPFIIGMYGIWIIDHARFTDAVYDTLHMYALSFGGEPDNIFIEIARWTAPLVTASWIITCFSILRNWWHNRIVYLMGNSIAVVPLAIPLLTGPASMSTMVIFAERTQNVLQMVQLLGYAAVVAVAVYVCFIMAPRIARAMGRTGINVMTRLMGLILAAMSVEVISEGLKKIFPLLAGA